jgi:hypothetical protein
MGTWRLNEAKSKLAPGAPKNNKVVYETEGIDFKVTTDGIDGAGDSTHSEWTGKFDGKDYPSRATPIKIRVHTKKRHSCVRFPGEKRHERRDNR